MTPQEKDHLRHIATAYEEKRKEFRQKATTIHQEAAEGKCSNWQAYEREHQLYNELDRSAERKAYVEQFKQFQHDPEFGTIANEVFNGIF